MDIDIKVLLKEMVDADGSDLFLTFGAPPSMKAFGKMVPMREERFAEGDVRHPRARRALRQDGRARTRAGCHLRAGHS